MKLCLHIHSNHSDDSKAPVSEILRRAQELGYDLISITDHNTVKGSLEARALNLATPRIILGAEFSTQYGHVLAYDIDEEIERTTPKIDAKRYDFEKLLENIKNRGGMAFLAHPFNSKVQTNKAILKALDGIEIYNSRIDAFVWRKRSKALMEALMEPGLIGLGNPDAHAINELDNAFMEVKGDPIKNEVLRELLSHEIIIHVKKVQNKSIAIAELTNAKKLKLKKVIKYSVRRLFGVYESIIKRGDPYEIIRSGKELK